MKTGSVFLKKFFLSFLTVIVMTGLIGNMEMKSYAANYGTVVETGEWSAEDGVSDVTWTVYDSGADGDDGVTTADTVVISGTGKMGTYDENLDERYPWRAYKETFTSIIIEEGITEIPSNSFLSCFNVTSVKLPNSLTRIETGVFRECKSLESIVLPDSLTFLGPSAFGLCINLRAISIPNNTVFNGSLDGCTSLTSIDLSNNEKTYIIAGLSFADCTNLKEVKLPACLTMIWANAFQNCTALEKLYIPKGVNEVHDTAFNGVSSNIKFYLETSEHLGTVTNLGGSNVAPILPYSISYTKNGVKEIIAEVFADGAQSYTIKEGDLPETEGVWRDTNYNNGQGRDVTVGTKFDNISGNINLQLIPGKVTGHPQNTTVAYGDTQHKDLSVTVKADAGTVVTYQWQVANATNGTPGAYTDVAGATNATYSVPDGKNAGSYSYRCVVNIGGYTFTSNAANVTVNQADGTITNKNYKTSYEYNKNAIAEPAASDFTYANTAKTPVFTWYKGDYTNASVNAIDKIATAPTKEGIYTLVVTVEGDTNYTAGELKLCINIVEHNHVNTEVRDDEEATCTQEGYTGDTYCTDCDKKISSGQTIGRNGHNYGSEVTKAPTVSENGIRTYTCTECGDNYTEPIDKIVENKPATNNPPVQNNQSTQNNLTEENKSHTNEEETKEETKEETTEVEETETEETYVNEDESKSDEMEEEMPDVNSEKIKDTVSDETIESKKTNIVGIMVGSIVGVVVIGGVVGIGFGRRKKMK